MIEGIIKELEEVKEISIKELDAAKTLFVSIDMNNGFCKEGALSSKDALDIVPLTANLLKAAKENKFPILAYTDTHEEDSVEFLSYPIHCLKDSKESLIVDELKEYMDVIIPKASTNGFLAKNPMELYPNVDTFVLSGCCTDICVYQYAITLKTYCNEHNLNKRIIVCKNITETFDAPFHNRVLYNTMFFKSMMNNGIEVLNLVK